MHETFSFHYNLEEGGRGVFSHKFWPTNDQVVIEDQFVYSVLDTTKFVKCVIYKI